MQDLNSQMNSDRIRYRLALPNVGGALTMALLI